MGAPHDPDPGRCLPRQRRLRGAGPARDVHADAPRGAGALVRLGVRQGVLVHHPLRRRGGRAEGLAHLLVGDRRDGARGPRPRPDRGPQVDAGHRPAQALEPARDREQGLHAAGGGRLRAAAARPHPPDPGRVAAPRRVRLRRGGRQAAADPGAVPDPGRAAVRRRAADRLGRQDDRQHRSRPGRPAPGQPGEREVPPLPVPQPVRDGALQLRPRDRRASGASIPPTTSSRSW